MPSRAWLIALRICISSQVEEYIAVMEKVRLRDGIRLAMAISAEGNKFLQDQQPWAVLKRDRDECAGLVTASECPRGLSLIGPVDPKSSRVCHTYLS